MLKGNSKPTAEYNLDAMQHRQQANRLHHKQEQRRDPTPTEVKDKNQPHALEIETHIVEINVTTFLIILL